MGTCTIGVSEFFENKNHSTPDDDERDHDEKDCDKDNGNYDDVKDDNCGSDPNSLVVSSPEAPCTLFLAAPHFCTNNST